VNKREHFELWMKDHYQRMSLERNDASDFYFDGHVDMTYRAWLASPKTRPTEPSKITKEQLAAMKADTSNIVDNLRGIYPGIAEAYPVTPLMLKAADEIERLRELLAEAYAFIRPLDDPEPWSDESLEAIKDKLRYYNQP
jgi:hypothetical protein